MSKENLLSVLNTIKQSPHPVATVWDLDSTLFCMKWRTEGILKDAVKSLNIKKQSPELAEKILAIQVEPTDWSLTDVFQRHQLNTTTTLFEKIHKYWMEFFFQNNYLHLDRPYEGSVKFLNLISQEKQAHIYYLTARNDTKMRDGTLRSLKQWNFPLKNKEQLILKPNQLHEDEKYKLYELQKLNEIFKTILFFENEPAILHMIHSQLPKVRIFWMDSTHSKKREGPPEKALTLNMKYEI